MWNLVTVLALSHPSWQINRVASAVADTNIPFAQVPIRVLHAADAVLAESGSDPIAVQSTHRLLTSLQKAGYPSSGQGVWIQSQDGVLLASHQARQPLPAASLTKIATTLGALRTWKADAHFVTPIGTDGRIVGNTLQGNLIVGGSGDPLFVWEEAIGVGNALEALGIRRVQGDLIVTPGFYMNFETNGLQAAAYLRQGMNSSLWDGEITAQYRTLPPGTRRPKIVITGNIRYLPQYNATTTLIKHRSLPLWQVLKQMNIFSNNIMADVLMQHLGGSKVVTQSIVQTIGISPQEIRLVNGSGLGQANQISPRAVVAMLIAIQKLSRSQGLTLADLFPGAECRCGTLQNRHFPPGAILKTGTLSDVSALAGVVQTRDRGTIWFALINRGAGEIGIFHTIQEEVLFALTQAWGTLPVLKPAPWQDTDRNELLLTKKNLPK